MKPCCCATSSKLRFEDLRAQSRSKGARDERAYFKRRLCQLVGSRARKTIGLRGLMQPQRPVAMRSSPQRGRLGGSVVLLDDAGRERVVDGGVAGEKSMC
jgi:hypothetical protein